MISISVLCFVYVVIGVVGIGCVSGEIQVYNSMKKLVKLFTSDYTTADFDPMVGLIVLADPPDACKPIAKLNLGNSTFSEFSKFVLIGGAATVNCSKDIKIENAANADYDLAILYGDRGIIPRSYSFFKKFFGNDGEDDDSIISINISYIDGEVIKTHYLFHPNSSTRSEFYYLKVVPGSDLKYYIVLFATVIAICFIVIIFFMICLLVKYIQERRRSRRDRLSSRQIKQLPTEKYTKGSQYDVCAICLENYNEGDKLRVLPCSHVYHMKCVDPWLMENRRNCPLCKRKVHLGDSSSESESDSEGASATESTPLITPTSPESTWGTFSGPSTSGEQLRQPGSPQSSVRIQPHIGSSQEEAESSESEIIATLPSVAGSVNAAYEDEMSDFRPKSV